MAPKKNKQATSAYYYFMLHLQQRNSGKKMSLAEAARIASDKWQNMSKAERAPFQKLADEEKSRQRGSGEKYTSQGRSYTEVEAEKNFHKEKLESMRKSVKERIEMALTNDILLAEEFFFIDINIFCEVASEDYSYFYPAEIAISKFTFMDGITNTLHFTINPGRLRTGYTFIATQNSNETHQLPVPPDAIGETDMRVIFEGILLFLRENNMNTNCIPFLYTLPQKIRVVEGVLKQLCDQEGINIEFKVFSITELFMYLMNATTSDKFDNPSIAEIEIEKDVYDYCKGLACEYHETTDVIHMCSLSKVKRWGFIISDYCMQFLGIDVIPGQHLPKQANISLCTSNMNSRCESRADSVFTSVSKKSQPRSINSNSAYSTPAPSVISTSPPKLQKPNHNNANQISQQSTGAIKKNYNQRSHSPVESIVSNVSSMSISSNLSKAREFTPNPIDFPLMNERSDSLSAVGRLEQIRRPKTQSQVAVPGAAASLLGYTTDGSTTDDGCWSTVSKRPHSKIGGGRGRGIAAKFSNP